jgi:hypothetical protein
MRDILPGTEIFAAETGEPKSGQETSNVRRDPGPGTRPANMAEETALLGCARKPAFWMVETEGTELPTPHPVIEPVSDVRVGNGNFRCRDGSVKTAVPPLRDRYRDAQRLERPPFWRD